MKWIYRVRESPVGVLSRSRQGPTIVNLFIGRLIGVWKLESSVVSYLIKVTAFPLAHFFWRWLFLFFPSLSAKPTKKSIWGHFKEGFSRLPFIFPFISTSFYLLSAKLFFYYFCRHHYYCWIYFNRNDFISQEKEHDISERSKILASIVAGLTFGIILNYFNMPMNGSKTVLALI